MEFSNADRLDRLSYRRDLYSVEVRHDAAGIAVRGFS